MSLPNRQLGDAQNDGLRPPIRAPILGVLAVAAAGVRAPLPHTERSWLGTHVASFQC